MNEFVFIINDVPPTANRMWRRNPRGGMYLTSEAHAFVEEVALAVKGARVPESWKYCAVEIIVEPRRRSGDVDNRIKPTLDALTKCGFWDDDDMVAFVSCCFGSVRGRTIVRITKRDAKFK